MLNKLNKLMKEMPFSLNDKQKKLIIQYVELLLKWNKAYNLTAITEPEQILIRHILDSLAVNPYLRGNTFIDVGTGPGLPGIPLAILNPECQFTLLDSLGKRIRFLKQVKHDIALNNIYPIQSRVENFIDHNGFDGVISRAFASLKDMVCSCQHLPKKDSGVIYALKGQLSQKELNDLPDTTKIMSTIDLIVPHLNEKRCLVILK